MPVRFFDFDLDPEDDDFKEKLNDFLEELYGSIEDLGANIENYTIYFSTTTIKKYIEKIINRQKCHNDRFYPSKEEDVKTFFSNIDSNFDFVKIKYDESDDLDTISKIIANQGRSGFSYLEYVDKVININKPVLLFYGIEQLSAFFSNLHLNFTESNTDLQFFKGKKKRRFRNHGISSHEFEEIEPNCSINDLLNKKIRLSKTGLVSRFFLTFLSDYHKSLLEFFVNQKEISLLELFENFFGWDSELIPERIQDKFDEFYGSLVPSNRLFSKMLTIYLISFIFSHLSRYKMHSWIKLLESDEKNISYFVNFFLKYGKKYYIKLLFNRIFSIDM